jgi:hypothetical protein
VEYGDYLCLVYKDSSNKIKEVGVIAKVTGFYRQVALNNITYQSVAINSVSLDILGRMKILEFNNIQKKFGDNNSSDLFFANIELLEDEISNKNFLKCFIYLNLKFFIFLFSN